MRLLRFGTSLMAVALAYSQAALDNATILKLVKAGIGEDTIVGMVNQQPGRYALSADDIIALKNAGVSDKIMAAMLVRNGAGTAPAASGVAASNTPSSQPAPPPPNANQPANPKDGITRVYVSDSQSWEMRGGWSAGGHTNSNGSGSWSGGGYQAGGARPQTAEIIKTFNQRCSGVTITNNPAKADFAVILDHEGGKGYARRRNKIVVFNREGDDIFSDSTRAVGSSVKDACQAILSHAGSRQSSAVVNSTLTGTIPAQPFAASVIPAAQNAVPSANLPPPVAPAIAAAPVDITLLSVPADATVAMGGKLLGRTPFTIKLQPGTYKAQFSAESFAEATGNVPVEAGHPNTFTSVLHANN